VLPAGGAALALVLAGCGGDDFKNEPRPPVPLELTGVIQAKKVTVSPNKVGAGPVEITISNQTDAAHTVTLESVTETKGTPGVLERVGPIQPDDTATLQKTLAEGTYEVRAGSDKATDKTITPAKLIIGPPRKSSSDKLLLP
jgi:hypothetical protein